MRDVHEAGRLKWPVRLSLCKSLSQPKTRSAVVEGFDGLKAVFRELAGQKTKANEMQKLHGVCALGPAVFSTPWRALENVSGWGSWMAFDVDEGGDLAVLREGLERYGYMVWPTTSATPSAPRLRVVLMLSREPKSESDYREIYLGIVAWLAGRGIVCDEKCVDPSRLFVGPQDWQPDLRSETEVGYPNPDPMTGFWSQRGLVVDVQDILERFPVPPEPEPEPVRLIDWSRELPAVRAARNAYVEAAVNEELETVRMCPPQSSRHYTVLRASARVASLLRAANIKGDDARRALQEACREQSERWYPRSLASTKLTDSLNAVKDGFAWGWARPRDLSAPLMHFRADVESVTGQRVESDLGAEPGSPETALAGAARGSSERPRARRRFCWWTSRLIDSRLLTRWELRGDSAALKLLVRHIEKGSEKAGNWEVWAACVWINRQKPNEVWERLAAKYQPGGDGDDDDAGLGEDEDYFDEEEMEMR